MERILIGDLHDHIDKEVSVAGYVDVRRDHGKLVFLDIRDRSGTVQAVALPNHAEAVEVAQALRPEYVVRVTANVNKRPEKMVNADQANGDIELELLSVTVLAEAAELPFEKEADLNLDTALDNRPFTLRSPRNQAIFKVQSEIVRAYREALLAEGFTEFQAPKIVGGDAEGGAEVFRLEYFKDRWAYLATSPQLYKQIMVGVYERVFTTGNVFRAEKHSTSRHLNEISMLDAEMGFVDSQYDVMDVFTKVLRHIVQHVGETCADELKLMGATLPNTPIEFPHVTLRDAQKLILEKTGRDNTEEPDLTPEDERWLCEYAAEELGSDFLYVTGFPVSKRPFYTMEDPDNPGYAKCFDLLFRGVEISSGNQRVHDYATLTEKMKDKGLEPENFSFYLQAFKYGMPPHGGWGLGLERLTEKMLGLDNVKEASLFPREINRIDTLLTQ